MPDYSCVLIPLGGRLRRKVLSFGRRLIRSRDLAGKGLEDMPHVTVRFGLHTDDPGDVLRVLRLHHRPGQPIRFRLGRVSLFPPSESSDGCCVVKLGVTDCPDLYELNRLLGARLRHTDTHPEYRPHVTLGYVRPGRGDRYAGRGDLAGVRCVARAVVFSDPERHKTVIPIS